MKVVLIKKYKGIPVGTTLDVYKETKKCYKCTLPTSEGDVYIKVKKDKCNIFTDIEVITASSETLKLEARITKLESIVNSINNNEYLSGYSNVTKFVGSVPLSDSASSILDWSDDVTDNVNNILDWSDKVSDIINKNSNPMQVLVTDPPHLYRVTTDKNIDTMFKPSQSIDLLCEDNYISFKYINIYRIEKNTYMLTSEHDLDDGKPKKPTTIGGVNIINIKKEKQWETTQPIIIDKIQR